MTKELKKRKVVKMLKAQYKRENRIFDLYMRLGTHAAVAYEEGISRYRAKAIFRRATSNRQKFGNNLQYV